MNNILISICIPVFNDIENLEESIRSSINQIQDDIEVIVLDNCSTDGSYALAKKFEGKNIQIYQNQKNLGAYGNHNQLLKIASGKYIKFLHSDDTLNENAINTFRREIIDHPDIDFFSFNTNFKNKYNSIVSRKEFKKEVFLEFIEPRQFVKFGSFLGTPSMTLFRKSITSLIGNFDTKMEPSSDTEFWDRVLENCKVKLCIDNVVTITDELIDQEQSYSLNRSFFLALLRRLEKLENRSCDIETSVEITKFKFRMLMVHLKLSFRLSILNWKFRYLFEVIGHLVVTIKYYKFGLNGRIIDLPIRLSRAWFDQLLKLST